MWWDSIETLGKLNISFQWIAGIFGVLGALAIVAALIFGGRLSSLQNVKDKQQTRLINKLKAEVAGRRLTPEMREKIQTSLKPMPNVKLEFTSIQGDRESFLFAQDLYNAFKKSGWSVEEVLEDQLLGSPGSIIQVRQKSQSLEVGQQIVDLLCAFGFEAKLITNEKWEPMVVDIVVTRRP
jgi:hypothetical protein